MDLARFVRITRDGSDTSGGTGYLLNGDRVLTARHVVAGAKELTVHFDGHEGPDVARKVWVEWQGEADLDVAVLGVEADLRLARQILEPGRFRGELTWRSRGWARAARQPAPESTSIVDAMSSLAGRAYEFSPTARRFEVGVDDPPDGVDWWKGVSGAPVFCDQWLVGVIAHGDPTFEGGRLGAIPIAALWTAPRFLEAVGYDASWQELRARRRRELIGDLAAILEEHPKAADAIAAESPAWGAVLRRKGGGVAALAEALCEAPSWRSVLEAFDQAHRKLAEGAAAETTSEEADAIVEVLDRVLPEVYGASEMHEAPFAAGGLLVTLPVETSTLAEVAMAAKLARSAGDSVPPFTLL